MDKPKKDRDVALAEHVAVAAIHLVFAAIITLTIITAVVRYLGL